MVESGEKEESVSVSFSGTTILAISILLSSIILTAGVFISADKVNSALVGLALAPAQQGTGANPVPPAQPPAAPPSQPPAPAADMEALAKDAQASVGKADAPITIVEFSDFQCPFCSSFRDNTFDQLKTQYIDTGKVRFVYNDFPLSSIHPQAQPAAEAARCAGEQDKFWEYHDQLFANQSLLGADNYKKWAADLDLDTAKFNDCVDTGKYKQVVNDSFAKGAAAGVSGTPSFFINGQLLVGAQPFSAFQQVLDGLLS